MDKVKKRYRIITDISAVLLFFAGLIAAIVIFAKDILGGIMKNSTMLAVNITIPTYYLVLSCVFVAILCVLVIFAYKLKNKLLVLLPLCYQLITIMSFILLAVLTSNISESTYTLTIIAFALFAPVYGFVYVTYVWSLFVIIPLFLASVIITYKLFKRDRELKLSESKKKKK